jgi:hypothetical protein
MMVVEVYRGVAICRTDLNPSDAATAGLRQGSCHEASILGWRVVGGLDGVRRQVDFMLKAHEESPCEGIPDDFRMSRDDPPG